MSDLSRLKDYYQSKIFVCVCKCGAFAANLADAVDRLLIYFIIHRVALAKQYLNFFIIQCVALAEQGDNRFGSDRLSIHLFVYFCQWLFLVYFQIQYPWHSILE